MLAGTRVVHWCDTYVGRYERSLEREITMKEVAQKTLYLGRSDASFDKPGLRAKLYRFLEDPNSSRMAKVSA